MYICIALHYVDCDNKQLVITILPPLLKYPNIQTSKHPNIKYPNMQISKYPNIKYSNFNRLVNTILPPPPLSPLPAQAAPLHWWTQTAEQSNPKKLGQDIVLQETKIFRRMRTSKIREPSSLYCWVLVHSCMKSWRKQEISTDHRLPLVLHTSWKKTYVGINLLQTRHILILFVINPLLDLRDVHRLLDNLGRKTIETIRVTLTGSLLKISNLKTWLKS